LHIAHCRLSWYLSLDNVQDWQITPCRTERNRLWYSILLPFLLFISKDLSRYGICRYCVMYTRCPIKSTPLNVVHQIVSHISKRNTVKLRLHDRGWILNNTPKFWSKKSLTYTTKLLVFKSWWQQITLPNFATVFHSRVKKRHRESSRTPRFFVNKQMWRYWTSTEF